MSKALVALGAFLLLSHVQPASAETRTYCHTDVSGTRTCTQVSTVRRTTHIMGIPVKDYERGLKQGKCMPSPAGPGVCGGG